MNNTRDGGIRGELARRLAGRRRTSNALRMTPMIDMIFLLLIFFLLTAEFRLQDKYLPFVLPSAKAGKTADLIPPLILRLQQNGEEVRAGIGDGGEVVISAASIDSDMLRFAEALGASIKASGRTSDDKVEIVASPELGWQYIASVYDVLFGMGIRNIIFRMTE